MKMHSRASGRERGVVLVVALLLLVMLTIVGVAALSGSMMQERMAGNAHLQTRAFEAASAGVASSLAFRDANMPTGQTCNSATSSQWDTGWVVAPEPVGDARLRQRMYCVDYGADSAGAFSGFELFVLNRGEVLGSGGVVATRDIEVRIDTVTSGMPGDGCAAFCFPAADDIDVGPCDSAAPDFCACAFERSGVGTIPRYGNPSGNRIIWNWSSGSLEVAGHPLEQGHAPAFTGPPNLMLAWQCHVTATGNAEDRLGQFKGGFGGGGSLGMPWEDPVATFEFVNVLRNLAIDNGSRFDGGRTWGPGGPSNRTIGGGFNQVTYVDGDATLGANARGSGILVVEGALNWGGGTPEFDGLIIALGGVFNGGGGGNGGNEGGSIVITNLNQKPSEVSEGTDSDPGFGDAVDIRMDFSGAGGAGFKFGCDALWALLEPGGPLHGTDAVGMWEPACDAGGGFTPAGVRTGLASWRENIGWRADDFFGPE